MRGDLRIEHSPNCSDAGLKFRHSFSEFASDIHAIQGWDLDDSSPHSFERWRLKEEVVLEFEVRHTNQSSNRALGHKELLKKKSLNRRYTGRSLLPAVRNSYSPRVFLPEPRQRNTKEIGSFVDKQLNFNSIS